MTPSSNANPAAAQSRLRFPLMLAVAVIVLAALWAALLRLGWELPSAGGLSAVQHGPLMIAGFLGTLLSLERAVALKQRWTYAGPALSAIGTLLILLDVADAGRALIVLAGVGLVAVFISIYRMHATLDVLVMGVGALLWVVGSILWLTGHPVYQAVPWWACFLILTVAGERLELSRVLRHTQLVQRLFVLPIAVVCAGLVLSLFLFDWGVRLCGVGFIGLAVWLLRNDVARWTIRKTGLTRFIAACLLPGYLWLAIGGGLWILDASLFVGGYLYDAMLHTLFLGFLFSMIFGHAPIILPSILGGPVVYRPVFYTHLLLLHSSLLLRLIGDLAFVPPLQKWAGLLNVVTVLIFLANTIVARTSSKS